MLPYECIDQLALFTKKGLEVDLLACAIPKFRVRNIFDQDIAKALLVKCLGLEVYLLATIMHIVDN